jgi:hypothetical protein
MYQEYDSINITFWLYDRYQPVDPVNVAATLLNAGFPVPPKTGIERFHVYCNTTLLYIYIYNQASHQHQCSSPPQASLQASLVR